MIRDSPAKLWPAVQSKTLRPRAVAQRWGTIPNVAKDHRKPTFTYSLATKNVSSMTGERWSLMSSTCMKKAYMRVPSVLGAVLGLVYWCIYSDVAVCVCV